MRIVEPKPFTFESGPRAVLLLHAFTGDSADVRMLGRYLQNKNYTTHAPIYRGHGKAPEKLIQTNINMWWEDALKGYKHLKSLGYEEIAVAGLSMGGMFSLKLAYTKPVKGLVAMATPIFFNNERPLTKAFQMFATRRKQLEQKNDAVIKQEVSKIMEQAPEIIRQLGPFIDDVRSHLNDINVPTYIAQPRKDQLIGTAHADFIHEHISSKNKQLKWYENSTHVITVDRERDMLNEDVYQFLETLDWKS